MTKIAVIFLVMGSIMVLSAPGQFGVYSSVGGGIEGISLVRAPSFNMELEENLIELSMGPFSMMKAEVNGNITVEKPREAKAERVYIELFPEFASEELLGSIMPEVIEIPSTEFVSTRAFKLTIVPTSNHVSTSIDGTFQIKGTWTYSTLDNEGSIEGSSGEIEVQPFCYFTSVVNNGAQLINVPVGKWQEIELEIYNEGNSDVRITIEKDLVPKDCDCTIPLPSFTLREGESKIVDLNIKQNSGGSRLNHFSLRIEGVSGGSNWTRYDDIFMKSQYSPTSFTNTLWFKLSIGALILLLVVVVTFIIVRRTRRKKLRSIPLDDIEI